MDAGDADRATAAPGAGSARPNPALIASRSVRGGIRRLRRWNRQDGAGESGLATLVEVHATQAAGDAAVAVALAGTLFFSVPTHEARGRVALYLLITMLPFALLAPVLGPLLDRFRHGRRTAMAVTMLARAGLALAIGHSLGNGHPSVTQSLTLYPAALGVLIAGKAYNIARSAAVPRLVPDRMTLVQANSRLTLVAVISPALAGFIAVVVAKIFGHGPQLFLGAVVYLAAAVMTLRLPSSADGGAFAPVDTASTGGVVRLRTVAADVRYALQSAAALRWLAGFLLLFGAFLVRVHPLSGLPPNVCLGVLAIGIGVGNVLGTTLGPRTASVAAGRLLSALLGATTAACVLTIFSYGLLTVFTLAIVASAAAAVAKLTLDATIQRRIDENVRTSMFARSETTLQIAWVVGGAVGIVLPTNAVVGFTIAAVVMAGALVFALRHRPRSADQPTLPAGQA
jgi:MFS family permease